MICREGGNSGLCLIMFFSPDHFAANRMWLYSRRRPSHYQPKRANALSETKGTPTSPTSLLEHRAARSFLLPVRQRASCARQRIRVDAGHRKMRRWPQTPDQIAAGSLVLFACPIYRADNSLFPSASHRPLCLPHFSHVGFSCEPLKAPEGAG